jgi:hypothetical protein
MLLKHPKTSLAIFLLIAALAFSVIIIKHANTEDNELQQRIYNHPEIKDTV